jgi:hypothetical protein
VTVVLAIVLIVLALLALEVHWMRQAIETHTQTVDALTYRIRLTGGQAYGGGGPVRGGMR